MGQPDVSVFNVVGDAPHDSDMLSPPASRWGQLRVSVLKVSTPMTVLPEVTIQDAIDIMHREGFDQLPVVDKSG